MDVYLDTFPFKEAQAIRLTPGKLSTAVRQRHLSACMIEHRTANSPMLHMIENVAEHTGFSFSGIMADTAIINGYQLPQYSPFIIKAGQSVEVVKRTSLNTIGVLVKNEVLTRYLGNRQDCLYVACDKYHASASPARFTKIRSILFNLLEEDLSVAVEKDYIDNLYFELAGCISSSYRAEFTKKHRNECLKRLKCFLRHAPIEALTLQNILAVTHCTARTLRNLTNHYFGMSPQKLIIVTRMHYIRDYIHHNQGFESLHQVLSELGVSNISRFKMDFKRMFGESIDRIEKSAY